MSRALVARRAATVAVVACATAAVVLSWLAGGNTHEALRPVRAAGDAAVETVRGP